MMKAINKEEAWKRLEELTEKVDKELRQERDRVASLQDVIKEGKAHVVALNKENEGLLAEIAGLNKRLATEDPLLTAMKGFVQDELKHVEKLAAQEGPIVLGQSKRQLVLEKLPPRPVPYTDATLSGQILAAMSTDTKKKWSSAELHPLIEKRYGETNKKVLSMELAKIAEKGDLGRTDTDGASHYVYWFPENIELVNKSENKTPC